MPNISLMPIVLVISLALGTGGWLSLRLQEPQEPARKAESIAAEAARNAPGPLPPKEDLVKDWEKPDFVLFVSGQLKGYIEPCGCTGLENQSGGLQRRFEVLQMLKARGWTMVPVDAGDQIRRRGIQSIIQLQTVFEALCKVMKYQAIGFGPDDLQTSATDLGQAMLDKMDMDNIPFVSANVTVLDPALSTPLRILEAGGRKIAITSVTGAEGLALVKDPDIRTEPPATGLARIRNQIQSSGADLKVLMVYGKGEEARELVKQFPVFDFVIHAGNAGDPIMLPEPVVSGNHTTRLIEVGNKGMHVGLIGFWGNRPADQRFVYERVQLDARFEDFQKDKSNRANLNEMEQLFLGYQESLKARYNDPASFTDISFRKHPSGNSYVGSKVCMDCHEEEFGIWKDGVDGEGGPHFRATRDLTDPGQRTWVVRNFDPECLSCHVTGWNPQEYYPYESGYLDLKKDVDLHGNGCENCHGPSSRHVAAEQGDIDATPEELNKYRLEVRMTLDQAKDGACMVCHDLDNSPDFFKDGAFEEYWAKVKHGDGIENNEAGPGPEKQAGGTAGTTAERPAGDARSFDR